MMGRLFILVLSLASLVLGSCARPMGDEHFPLSEGMRWEYNIEAAIPVQGIQSGHATTRIDGAEEIDGQRYVKTITVFSGIPGIEPETNYFRKAKDGLYQIRGKRKASGEFLLIPFPLEVSRSWNVQAGGYDLAYTVESLETAELPAESYDNCFSLVTGAP